jgi:uncharacterized protein (DUF433 family)
MTNALKRITTAAERRRRSARRFPCAVGEDFGLYDSHRPEQCDAGGRDFSVSFETVLRRALAEHPLVTIDSTVLAGAPRIAGTRIPLYMVIDAILHTGNINDVADVYRDLSVEQIREALSFAADVLEHRVELEHES